MKREYRQVTTPEMDDSEIWDVVNEVDLDDLARVSGLDLLMESEQ
jgi:hypothetical protein